ncbi:hypothetical protein GCM10010195_43940 [Kitasatospora griseola]|nr:hypothetical protein GCM10010195_43940 [Kitasatospora griseola]
MSGRTATACVGTRTPASSSSHAPTVNAGDSSGPSTPPSGSFTAFCTPYRRNDPAPPSVHTPARSPVPTTTTSSTSASPRTASRHAPRNASASPAAPTATSGTSNGGQGHTAAATSMSITLRGAKTGAWGTARSGRA